MNDADDEAREQIQEILADATFDTEDCLDSRDEAIWELVGTYGWECVLAEMIAVLRDDKAKAHWIEASVVIWRGIDLPMPAVQVIALLHRRLLEHLPAEHELDENLVWSITCNLKQIDYLSDYQPMRDPEIIAEMARR
ncbi:MAG: hypothetical protein ABL973_04085 [Micropepsaceae bacterium]